MHGYETDTVTKLETNLDDCPGEVLGNVLEQLFAAGALDAWFTPIQMKKHRPAVMLSVLCEEERAQALADLIFAETTAFGMRIEKVIRLKLARRFEEVSTPFGTIKVKVGCKGNQVLQFAPEFESCRAAAERSNVPMREVYAAAMRAQPPK
jgi:pyridinium-3,5-bisthiocarboxylic acid mononucleotide nickel chelatase